MIRIAEVQSREDETAFIRLPGQLAADDPNWVEPLMIERREFLDKKHNAFFEPVSYTHLTLPTILLV